MVKSKNKLPVYLIEWLDATGDSGWRNIEHALPLAQVFSVGILVEETEDAYTLVQSVSGDDNRTDIDNSIVIPKSGIQKVTHLEVPTKVKKRSKK